LKKIIARECELNWYLSCSIEKICSYFKPFEGDESSCPYKFLIIHQPTMYDRYQILNGKGTSYGGTVPKAHTNIISKHLLDIAKIDTEFYIKLEAVNDAARELEHLRNSLVDINHTEEMIGVVNVMVSFSGYALEEIEEAQKSLKSLYKYCTGLNEPKPRLR